MDSYTARLTEKPDQPRFTIIGSGSWSARADCNTNAAIHCTR